MASDRPEGSYSIRDLPEDVRKKVLDRWRYEIWDDHDSQWLTESFGEILEERGIVDPDVYWSLSYSQGDGVCWKGMLDLGDFFKWVFSGEKQAKPYVRPAKSFIILQDMISVRISNRETRYCHWNSMDVELEIVGSEIDLVSERYREEVREFYEKRGSAYGEWERRKQEIEWERNAPIREWNKTMDERSRLMRRGPKEWRPAIGPRPDPLDIPYPPEPKVEIPVRYSRMLEKAKELNDNIDPLIKDLREFLKGWVEDTSRELEKIGYGEMEYRQSDENIIEFLDNNEYLFDEDGEEV